MAFGIFAKYFSYSSEYQAAQQILRTCLTTVFDSAVMTYERERRLCQSDMYTESVAYSTKRKMLSWCYNYGLLPSQQQLHQPDISDTGTCTVGLKFVDEVYTHIRQCHDVSIQSISRTSASAYVVWQAQSFISTVLARLLPAVDICYTQAIGYYESRSTPTAKEQRENRRRHFWPD